MIDLTFVLESLKRRWIAIVIVTVLAAGCGVVSSASSSDSSAPVAPTYTAEATIYVDAYESSDANEYNYVVSDGYFIADARRIVVSDSVAGEVRRTLGEDVSIATGVPHQRSALAGGGLAGEFPVAQHLGGKASVQAGAGVL